MRTLGRLMIFLAIFLPIVFASQLFGQMFSVHINLYGLYFMAAVCGLRRSEAVLATVFLGLWLDALQPDMRLFGLQALLLSALTYACYKQNWRVVFEAYSRTFAVCAQCFLQPIGLLCVFAVYRIPIRCFQFYVSSFLASVILSAILTPPLLHFQKKRLVL